MILWDIIRDWFVHYVTGGVDSSEEYIGGAMVGAVWYPNDNSPQYTNAGSMYLPINGWSDYNTVGEFTGISVADWLATTGTIITLIFLCLFLFLAVKWVFNVFRNTLERVGK